MDYKEILTKMKDMNILFEKQRENGGIIVIGEKEHQVVTLSVCKLIVKIWLKYILK